MEEDESRVSMEMNVRQLETLTLDRGNKEKKTSKIKKFFKKLSNKKDKGDDLDHLAQRLHVATNDFHLQIAKKVITVYRALLTALRDVAAKVQFPYTA